MAFKYTDTLDAETHFSRTNPFLILVPSVDESPSWRRDGQGTQTTQFNKCPNMSVWFRCSRAAHYCEKCNCPWPQIDTHNIHNNNMINSTMCSLSAVLMLSGQSINSLMGMWVAALTLSWCSVIRVKCNSEWYKELCFCVADMQIFWWCFSRSEWKICPRCIVFPEKFYSANTRQGIFTELSMQLSVQVCLSQVEDGDFSWLTDTVGSIQYSSLFLPPHRFFNTATNYLNLKKNASTCLCLDETDAQKMEFKWLIDLYLCISLSIW